MLLTYTFTCEDWQSDKWRQSSFGGFWALCVESLDDFVDYKRHQHSPSDFRFFPKRLFLIQIHLLLKEFTQPISERHQVFLVEAQSMSLPMPLSIHCQNWCHLDFQLENVLDQLVHQIREHGSVSGEMLMLRQIGYHCTFRNPKESHHLRLYGEDLLKDADSNAVIAQRTSNSRPAALHKYTSLR